MVDIKFIAENKDINGEYVEIKLNGVQANMFIDRYGDLNIYCNMHNIDVQEYLKEHKILDIYLPFNEELLRLYIKALTIDDDDVVSIPSIEEVCHIYKVADYLNDKVTCYKIPNSGLLIDHYVYQADDLTFKTKKTRDYVLDIESWLMSKKTYIKDIIETFDKMDYPDNIPLKQLLKIKDNFYSYRRIMKKMINSFKKENVDEQKDFYEIDEYMKNNLQKETFEFYKYLIDNAKCLKEMIQVYNKITEIEIDTFPIDPLNNSGYIQLSRLPLGVAKSSFNKNKINYRYLGIIDLLRMDFRFMTAYSYMKYRKYYSCFDLNIKTKNIDEYNRFYQLIDKNEKYMPCKQYKTYDDGISLFCWKSNIVKADNIEISMFGRLCLHPKNMLDSYIQIINACYFGSTKLIYTSPIYNKFLINYASYAIYGNQIKILKYLVQSFSNEISYSDLFELKSIALKRSHTEIYEYLIDLENS